VEVIMSGMFKKLTPEKEVKEFVQKADLKKSRGSKKRSETYIAVYFTKEEKEKILELANEKGLSASSYIRSVLKELKII
jgi:predicted DNA binding CopG/RHH family protein